MNKIEERISVKNLMRYALLWLSWMILLTIFLFTFNFLRMDPDATSYTMSHSPAIFSIWLNNTQHFLQYFIFFPFAPVFIMWDSLMQVTAITIAMKAYGFSYVLRRLLWHGLIELPNLILYSYLAMERLKILLRYSMRAAWTIVWIRKRWFLLSYGLLVLAAIVEGAVYG